MNLGFESEVLEFKETTGEKHEACETIAAILNKHGYGTIYFGVADNGEVKGQVISDSTIKDLTETLFRDIEPRIIPTIETVFYEEKAVLKVTFSGTQKPYSAFGKFLIRVGTQNRKMSRDELIKIVKENDYSLPWEKENSGCSIEDIDDETLQNFFYEAINCGRLQLGDYNKVQILRVLDLYGDFITNACNALFGKKTNITLKVACFATDEKLSFIDLKVFRGNIYNLIQEAMTYLSNHIDWRVEIGSIQRTEIPEIPIRALREMVINAFAHANYRNNPEIEINIHPSKITIFNPGSFPDNLTPRDFINRDIASVKRNPLILETLFRCKDVEKTGTGFKRMNDLCRKSDIKWLSENTAYGFYFTFLRNHVHPNVSANVYVDVKNNDERKILQMISANPKILKSVLAKEISKSEKTVQRILLTLTQKGYIKRIGNNQYGYWEILK